MEEALKNMQESFESVKESGKNTANGLTDWLKNAAILEDEDSVQKAKELLGIEGDVSYETFRDAVKKIAQDKSAKIEEYCKKLVDTVSTIATNTGNAAETVTEEAQTFTDAIVKFKDDTSNLIHAGTSTVNQAINEQKTKVVEAAKNVFSAFSSSQK